MRTRSLAVFLLGPLFGFCLLLAACLPPTAPAKGAFLITKTSPYSVSQTMDRAEAAVLAKGAKVFARINHAAGAQKSGQSLPPEEVLIFGNPALGTPLLLANPRIGLDLPVKLVVWQEDGATHMAFTHPALLGARYGIALDHPALVKMRAVLDAITDEAIAPAP